MKHQLQKILLLEVNTDPDLPHMECVAASTDFWSLRALNVLKKSIVCNIWHFDLVKKLLEVNQEIQDREAPHFLPW